jgi:hypothetical protein
MVFPITDLMDRDACVAGISEYFHPEGLKCPHCGTQLEQTYWFRRTKRSQLDVYHCRVCKGIYNVYSSTVFEGRHFDPEQVVLFIQGVCQGKSTAQLAREMSVSSTTATEMHQQLQANAECIQPQTPLDDLEVETDEMFQNAGELK